MDTLNDRVACIGAGGKGGSCAVVCVNGACASCTDNTQCIRQWGSNYICSSGVCVVNCSGDAC